MPLGQCVVTEAGYNWYLHNIKYMLLIKKKVYTVRIIRQPAFRGFMTLTTVFSYILFFHAMTGLVQCSRIRESKQMAPSSRDLVS
jgi:hypothetical protein